MNRTEDTEYRFGPARLADSGFDFPVFSTQYPDVRGRQLEGTYPNNPTDGVWATSVNRILRGWGNVEEADFPSVDLENWPPVEPDGLDEKARQNRTLYYQRVRTPADCLRILGLGRAVLVNLEITKDWFDSLDGVIRSPKDEAEIIGTHAVSVVGFDLSHLYFHFENSWGTDWGNSGFGVFSIDYFRRFHVESWVSDGVGENAKFPMNCGINELCYGLPDFLGRHCSVLHIREVYDSSADDRIGWAFAVERNGFLDVEELFVKPRHRGKGYGNRILQMLLDLSEEHKLPIRLLIPFSDWRKSNANMVLGICRKLKLTAYWSPVRWVPVHAIPSALSNAEKLTEVDFKSCSFTE